MNTPTPAPSAFDRRAALLQFVETIRGITTIAVEATPFPLPDFWRESTIEDVRYQAGQVRSLGESLGKHFLNSVRETARLAVGFVDLLAGSPLLVIPDSRDWFNPEHPLNRLDLDPEREVEKALDRLMELTTELKGRSGHLTVTRSDVRVMLDPPQVIIDGTPYAVKPDAAVYLAALQTKDDWMSDPEFLKQHPEFGDSARPDKWRKKLPLPVHHLLETHKSRGTRWKTSQ